MRRIAFDYAPRKPRRGRLLLAAGVLSAAVVAYMYATLADEKTQWEAVAEKAAPPSRANSSTARTDIAGAQLRQEIEQANDVIRRLSLPWNELFKAMEDSTIDKVALLSVQPDAQQRIVNLNGEARAYADVLTYMTRLDSTRALTKVRLLNHEVKRDDPQRPVAFTVTARWRIAP